MKRTKIFVKLLLRSANDIANRLRFARKRESGLQFGFEISLSQEIKPSETLGNKLYNIATAADKINGCIIFPGEILSFWKIVGNPESQLKPSRSIIAGKIATETGGGICQVSGIIYHIGILAGLEILERHNHSIDIYTDETRFTPLGTDATVVYGYKDLRVRNNFDFPIKFILEITNKSLSIKMLSSQKVNKRQLVYEVSESETEAFATVKIANHETVSRSVYKKHADC
jgi:vancomycin resistance protein VanW